MKNTELKAVFKEISEDIYKIFQRSGIRTVEKHLEILKNAIDKVAKDNKKEHLTKNLKYSLIKRQNAIIGKVYAPKRKGFEHRVLFGTEPSEIGSWKKEKVGIIKWIRKNKKSGAFPNVKTKRELESFAYFIYRKQKIYGIPGFNYYYLGVMSYGSLDEFQNAVFNTFEEDVRNRLNRLINKNYKVK